LQTQIINQSEVLLSLEEGEEFTHSALVATTTNLVAANALLRSIFLVISPEIATEHDLFLREQGWTFAGVVSAHKTYWKLRTGIQSSEASVSQLAVDEPMLSRSPAERDAIELMRQKYGPRSGAA
jgi:hypothetical protein